MESHFIQAKLAEKISQLLETEIPVGKFEFDDISSSCGRLSYEGTNSSCEKMERNCKFKFRWYDQNWNVPLDKIHTLENFLREAEPEIFSDGGSNFHVRYYKINSSNFNHINISGMMFYCAELNFSIVY